MKFPAASAVPLQVVVPGETTGVEGGDWVTALAALKSKWTHVPGRGEMQRRHGSVDNPVPSQKRRLEMIRGCSCARGSVIPLASVDLQLVPGLFRLDIDGMILAVGLN